MVVEDLVIKGSKQTSNNQSYLSFPKQEYWKWLEQLPDGYEILITLSDKRNLGQNALFHKCIAIIADYMGEEFDTIKYYLVCKFFGYKEEEIEGTTCKIPVSTSRLSKKEFAKGLNKLYIFADEINVKLPETDIINKTLK